MSRWASWNRSSRSVSSACINSTMTWCSATISWARSKTITSSPSDDPALGGPPGELVAAGELELAQHGGDVSLDRFDRQRQLPGHFLVGVPTGDEPQHLPLPGGQLIELGVGREADGAGEGVEHEAGQAGREHGV